MSQKMASLLCSRDYHHSIQVSQCEHLYRCFEGDLIGSNAFNSQIIDCKRQEDRTQLSFAERLSKIAERSSGISAFPGVAMVTDEFQRMAGEESVDSEDDELEDRDAGEDTVDDGWRDGEDDDEREDVLPQYQRPKMSPIVSDKNRSRIQSRSRRHEIGTGKLLLLLYSYAVVFVIQGCPSPKVNDAFPYFRFPRVL